VIVNESKAFPSRLFGHLSAGAKIELFLMEQRKGDWAVLANPLKKLRPVTSIYFAKDVVATITDKIVAKDGTQFVPIRFSLEELAFANWLHGHGYMPLPP